MSTQPVNKAKPRVTDEMRAANKKLGIILGLVVIGFYAGFILISSYIR